MNFVVWLFSFFAMTSMLVLVVCSRWMLKQDEYEQCEIAEDVPLSARGNTACCLQRRDIVIAVGSSLLTTVFLAIIYVGALRSPATQDVVVQNNTVIVPQVIPCPDRNPLNLRNASTLQATRALARSLINATRISEFSYDFSLYPHIAGSARNNDLAESTVALYRSFGFDDVRVERLPALLMNLTHRSLNRTDPVTGAVLETIHLDEVNVVNQPGWSTALPPTSGYTGVGLVRGPLVWANYGREEDFAAIQAVDLTGSIVVMRYGEIFRGDKVRFAQRRGAVGVLLCYDAWDMVRGPSFPNGPWANNDTVQRGSITNNEGDPLTPTWPSEFGGPVISVEQTFNGSIMGRGMTLPDIPVQPISIGNAQRMLQGLSGTLLPEGWNNTGFLPLFSNGIGPGPATAALHVERDLVVYNLTNVVGVLYGEEEPDRTVIVGSHRDAWTYGAGDPISGHSVVLEIGRALGSLRATGWRPRRTIQLASWDGEEWAIIGSNEFVETNIELLRQRAVAYLNLDIAVSGSEYLELAGSPLLRYVANEMAKEVQLPNGQLLSSISDPYEPAGSGSDHVGFIQLAGVPVLDCALLNRSSSYEAVYHSNYDSYYWMSNFGDPGFLHHKVMAEFYASIMLSLADSNVLPLHVEDYSTTLDEWTAEYTSNINNSFADFSFMQSSLTLLRDGSTRAATKRAVLEAQCETQPANVSWQALREVNDIAMGLERVFLGRGESESGQPWYLHVIFTPSASDSYSASTMPLIAQGLATQNATIANFNIGRVAQFVRRAATYVNSSSVMPPWYQNIGDILSV